MKDSEEELLRFSDADDAILECVKALQSSCEKRRVKVQVALIAVVTSDGLLCRTAFNPALCRGRQEPDLTKLHSEVGDAMKSFVEEIAGATIVEADLGVGGPKS